jgi:hypothetical protein
MVLASIVNYFGKEWFEGGWHDLKFVDPAYDDEDVKVCFDPLDDGPAVQVRVVGPDGRPTCVGNAGLGDPDFEVPPSPPSWVFPGSEIGRRFEEHRHVPALRDYIASLRAAGASAAPLSEWCRDRSLSPWRKIIVPPAGLLPVTRWAQNKLPSDGALPPGMNGRMQFAFRGPVFAEEPLTAHTWIAGKGASGKTWARTIGFSLRDEMGHERVHGLHTIRWWAP